jgi:glycosyltransferase involved in cell wall biosynthesis
MSGKTIAIGYNTCHYVWMMRANLIRALIKEGYNVVVLAPADAYAGKLKQLGAVIIDLPMSMNKNPVTDAFLTMRFRRELGQLKPSVFLGYTAKPNIFGTLAAASLGIPTINNIAGLGSGFISGGLVTILMKVLYRISLARSSMVFFQNPDDADLFAREEIVTHDRTAVLPGSGVDTERYVPTQVQPRHGRRFRFLLIGRMLRDKGLYEFVEAARIIFAERDDVEFRLLGAAAVDNPAAIPARTLESWVTAGLVTYQDFCEDVRPEIWAADCVVLPSYREGTPRVLLEAASCGRPVITADAVGCRETVIDGETGFLCAPRNSNDLAAKMRKILNLAPEKVMKMGQAGRRLIESKFDENIVINCYLDAINWVTDESLRGTESNLDSTFDK